jgi:hypothetical protein
LVGVITSSKKTDKAQTTDIIQKWNDFQNDKNIIAIIWSAQSTDALDSFIEKIIKKSTKTQLDEFINMKNLPNYLLENYKKYFFKSIFIGEKDYVV